MGAPLKPHVLERRRRSLGMSQAELARRSGQSTPTVIRILTQGIDSVATGKVRAVAKALGIVLQCKETVSVLEMQEREAQKKARDIVRMLQGTSGLESQSFDDDTYKDMVQQTVHELMAGPKRKLWTQM